MTNQLITILARGGSKRLPNKSLLEIDGKPLIQHTVDCASNYACLINQKNDENICGVVLSSDSDEILAVDKHILGFKRDSELAQDHTPKMDVIRDAVKHAEDYYSLKFEIIIDLDVTNPMRTVEDVENAVLMFEDKKPFSLVSVVRARKIPGFNIVNMGSVGNIYLTQSVFNPLDLNASIYVYDRDWLQNGNDTHPVTEHGRGTICYIMDEKTRTDIDTLEDFLTVKARMERKSQ